MAVLHRNLQRAQSQRDRLEAETLAHDVAKLKGSTLLEVALQWISVKRQELEAQLVDAEDACRQLRQEMAWLDEQRDQLVREAAAEKR